MQRIEVSGSGHVFNVGKILCIGRNYAKHAAEMGGDVPRQPWVFLKPSSAMVRSGGSIVLPSQSTDIHHEIELVAVIRSRVKDIGVEKALDCVMGYAVGLDMTARDLQSEAKVARAPWSVAKGFDTFAPLGEIVSPSSVRDPQDLEIRLSINGAVRQDGTTSDMIFTVAELISYCSKCFTLYPGDLLYTGTPDGVGPVVEGDELDAKITGLPDLKMSVRA